MHEWSDQLHNVASLYYVQQETMESIARQLGTSRSTVSRLLKEARDTGLVTITLAEPVGHRSSLASTLERIFGVRTHIVGVRDGATEMHRLDRVAKQAASLLGAAVFDGATIGIAWGTTLAAIVQHVRPRELNGTTVVQLNGGANGLTSGIPYVGSIISEMASAWGSQTVYFPVPAFFDYAEARAAMWRERSVQSVLAVQRKADIAVFGVGSLQADVPSHVYAAGYLDADDMAEIRQDRVIGDVCTVLLREDGSWRDVSMNARASGLNPAELQSIPKRFCVAAGPSKAGPLLAALRAKVATDLVVDDGTARALLQRL